MKADVNPAEKITVISFQERSGVLLNMYFSVSLILAGEK